MPKMKYLPLSLLLALPITGFAAEKHVHGEAEFNIAFAGTEVLIEFKSPAANIVGFESVPRNPKETQIVEQAYKTLATYSRVITFNGGTCEQVAYTVASGFDEHIEAGEQSHDHDEHEHEHEHDEHDHKDHHDEHNHHQETHSDFEVSYRLQCDDITSITAATVSGFSAFSGLEEVAVNWLTERHQGSSTTDSVSETILIKH